MLKFLKVSQVKLEGRQAALGPVQAELIHNWSVLQSISCSKVTNSVLGALNSGEKKCSEPESFLLVFNAFYFLFAVAWDTVTTVALLLIKLLQLSQISKFADRQPYGLKSSF